MKKPLIIIIIVLAIIALIAGMLYLLVRTISTKAGPFVRDVFNADGYGKGYNKWYDKADEMSDQSELSEIP